MWIESHLQLRQHWKTARLSKTLGLCPAHIVGHLHCLWWWAFEYAQDGSLADFTADDIAVAAGYEGDAALFVRALVESRFVDESESGLFLHDWDDYGGKYLRTKQANAERMRVARGKTNGSVHSTCNARAMHVRRSVPLRGTGTSTGTGESTSGSTSTSSGTDTCMSFSEESVTGEDPMTHQLHTGADRKAQIAALFAYYKDKIQPAARLCPSEKITNRLKKFTLDELRTAIDHFAADTWWMENNASRGGEWFFHSDARIEQLLLLDPSQRKDSSNGKRTSANQQPRNPGAFAKYG